jgi:hypothetical protein
MSLKSVWTLLSLCVSLAACGADRKDDGDGDSGNEAGDGGEQALGWDAAVDAARPGMDGLDGGRSDGSQSDTSVVTLSDASAIFRANDAGRVLCGTVACQCSDGVDQDNDGLLDMADPECVSPWDNDESTFATGISGDNRDEACQDCFFDGNSGSGNDGCRIATSCLVNPNDSSSGRGSCDTCTANDRCRSFCQDYTPNGCDCFGCCTVHLGSNITKSVQLGTGCDINGTTLSAACVACIPSTSCVNECGRCELCPGKTLADLPSDCVAPPVGGDGGTASGDGGSTVGGNGDAGTGTPTPSCDLGETRCGDGLPACPADELCTFGCCIRTLYL